MDNLDLHPSVEQLADNIDDLEESLAPLINTALSASTSKLPLLDKAKLYTLVTYAIESVLFSYLRLNGVEAKSHPIFSELSRVKQYFEKIKLAESSHVKRNTTLDKDAAGRFVKHALSGNDKYDKERAERMEKEKAGAKRKFEDMAEKVGSATRFEAISKKIKADEAESSAREQDTTDTDSKKKKKSKKNKETIDSTATTESVAPKKKKSSKAPRGRSEAFQALLNGPIPTEEEHKKKKKRKSKGEKQEEE